MRRPTGFGDSSGPRAFTLVELVVVVIIGIVVSVAVPRFSSMGRRNRRATVEADLTVLRGAIDRCYAEHGRYPGYNPANGAPDGTLFVDQLVKFTDATGRTSDTRTSPYTFGPFLRPPFPTNPINELDTVRVIANAGSAKPLADTLGWFAVLETGQFTINTSAAAIAIDAVDQAAVEPVK